MLPDAFGCVVANRFGGLPDDEADPFDLLTEAELERDKKRKVEAKKVKQKKPGQRESQKDRRVPVAEPQVQDPHAGKKHQAREPASGEGRGGGAEAQRGPRRPAFVERRTDPEEYPQEYCCPKPYDANPDGRDRGGYRAAGGRGAGYSRSSENYMRGKREYERHSGTGISPEEKRGGRGPWNWGSVQDTTGDLMEVTADAAVKPEETQSPVEGEEHASEVDGEMVVQVAMEMSLDEWKALQETSRSKAELNLRKAESNVPSKATVIHQSKRVDVRNVQESVEEMEDEGHFLRRSMNDITCRLDINFGSLGRPARGGRGRGRGYAAAGPEKPRPRPEMLEVLAPNPDDPEDFPALSAAK